MTTDTLDTKELMASLDDTATQLLDALATFNEDEINVVPFENGWTAAQVAEHLAKVNASIARGMNKPGRAVDRSADKRVDELKDMFMDFETKRKSPDFVEPTSSSYTKGALSSNIKSSTEQIKEAARSVNLSEAIDNPAFGELTKLELIAFANHHMQRHIQQLKNIKEKISNP